MIYGPNEAARAMAISTITLRNSRNKAIGTINVSASQLRLILSVLGEMPYKRVSGLLHSMHQQMQEAKESDQ